MNRIAPGSHVTLHYRLSALVEGVERDVINTYPARPATLQLGAGQLAPALENHLLGLTEGDEARFEVAAADGYGERNPQLVQSLARAAFDANADGGDYQIGDPVRFTAPDGRGFSGVLKARDERRVLVDFNHPLAGLPLRFQVKVIGVL